MSKHSKYWAILSQVTTVSEVAECWEQPEHRVRYHMLYGDFCAVKINGSWIIALGSVIDFWGQPTNLAAEKDVSGSLRELVSEKI